MSAAHASGATLPLTIKGDRVIVEPIDHSGQHPLGLFVFWESEASQADGQVMLVRVLATGDDTRPDVRANGVYIVKPYRTQFVRSNIMPGTSWHFMNACDLEAELEGYDD